MNPSPTSDRLVFVVESNSPDVPTAIRLRRFLKCLLRSYGLNALPLTVADAANAAHGNKPQADQPTISQSEPSTPQIASYSDSGHMTE